MESILKNFFFSNAFFHFLFFHFIIHFSVMERILKAITRIRKAGEMRQKTSNANRSSKNVSHQKIADPIV